MTCAICSQTSKISYITSRYGEVCEVCMWRIRNMEDAKKEEEERDVMYKRYNVRRDY